MSFVCHISRNVHTLVYTHLTRSSLALFCFEGKKNTFTLSMCYHIFLYKYYSRRVQAFWAHFTPKSLITTAHIINASSVIVMLISTGNLLAFKRSMNKLTRSLCFIFTMKTLTIPFYSAITSSIKPFLLPYILRYKDTFSEINEFLITVCECTYCRIFVRRYYEIS